MDRDAIFDVLAPDDIRLKGHRIGVEDVLDLYHAGRDARGIVDHYPSLELPLVEAALDSYEAHKADLDAYLAAACAWQEEQTRLAEETPSPYALRMRALLEERRRRARAEAS